jgi:hypothetical protein
MSFNRVDSAVRTNTVGPQPKNANVAFWAGTGAFALFGGPVAWALWGAGASTLVATTYHERKYG